MPAPNPPTGASATAGNRRAIVTFTAPVDDGGFLITSYTVTAVDETTPANGGQTASGANPPLSVVGLTAGDTYHFTVTATNSAGTSAASADSNSVVILPATVPDAPQAPGVIANDGQVIVSFLAPAYNGGSAITGYEATAIDETNPANGGQTATGASSPLTVTGLTNGDGYTFQVVATNAQGDSAPSSKTALAIPVPDEDVDAPSPPYADAASFPIEKPVNLIQISDELTTAAGQAVRVAITGPVDILQPISPTNDATLWVAPNSISSGLIIGVVEDHVANPAYGMAQSDLDFQSAVQKVVNNPNAVLTDDEMQAAVRGLLLRSLIPIAPPIG